MSIVYELEKKSSLVTRAFSAKSCTRDTDSLHSCTRLRLVQEMACLYHECKILPRKHSYPNLIPIIKPSCILYLASRFIFYQVSLSLTSSDHHALFIERVTKQDQGLTAHKDQKTLQNSISHYFYKQLGVVSCILWCSDIFGSECDLDVLCIPNFDSARGSNL